MPCATSLRGALDRHKGVDYELQRQKKLRKAAEKRKKSKQQGTTSSSAKDAEDAEDSGSGSDDEEVNENVASGKPTEKSGLKGKEADDSKKKKKKKQLQEAVSQKEKEGEEEGQSEESESDESDDDDASVPVDASRLLALGSDSEDSDSDSDSDSDDQDDEDEDEDAPALVTKNQDGVESGSNSDDDEDGDEAEEEDVPFSDLESLADEDRGDIIPHQRLTINNTISLTAALNRISLPYDAIPFSAHQSITSKLTTANKIPDIDDDLQREKVIMQQALEAAIQARASLKALGVPFSRPVDYFAEMVKSEDQMSRVKGQLVKEATAKKAAMEARKLRDLKKRGKKIQVEKEQERAKERRALNEKVESLKKKRAGAPIMNETEADMFDIALDTESKRPGGADSSSFSRKRRASSSHQGGSRPDGPNLKRQKKNEKFGFGGKKRFSKSGDAVSSADISGFSTRKMKGSGGKGGAAKRPGKSRRASARK